MSPLAPFSPSSVVVFRALQLGDMLCSVPALRALRKALPQAKVTLVGLPWAREFVQRFDAYLDEFIEFPGYPGLPEQPPRIDAIPAFLQHIQQRHFDLAIQLHGSGRYVNSLTALFGAKQYAGFYTPDDYCPNPETFITLNEAESEITRFTRLMKHLGIPSDHDDLEFPLKSSDLQALESLPEWQDLEECPYVCLHPGARWNSRRWAADHFAEVGDWLVSQGFRVVLTGTKEEYALGHSISRQMRAPSINLIGRLRLGTFAALLRQARLLVCNDTGVSHIAAGLKVPSVVLYLGSDIKRWAPLNRQLHRAVWHPVACRPCTHWDCPIGHPCATELHPDQVVSQARDLLLATPAPAN